VGVSLTSQAVVAALGPLFLARGAPRFVRRDNGPEFIAAEVQAWLQASGSAPHYIDPGCPWQNGVQESFHGKLRDELLDREAFASVEEVRVLLEAHRRWYNEQRPHSSLNDLPPVAFAGGVAATGAGTGTKQAARLVQTLTLRVVHTPGYTSLSPATCLSSLIVVGRNFGRRTML